jgi:hypothetical protein
VKQTEPDFWVLMEVAALMARTHSPLVTVIERDGTQVTVPGTITAARLMQHCIGAP